MSKQLLEMAEIPWDESAINLNMYQIKQICHAYHNIIGNNVSLSKNEEMKKCDDVELLNLEHEEKQILKSNLNSSRDTPIPRFDIRL